MMEKNQIKICGDPYRKHIDYYWYEGENRWTDMEEMDDSPFNTDEFISSSVSQKAYDIFKVIKDKLYNPTIGIKVLFEGTDDDFADMVSVKEMYFSEYEIELERGLKKMENAKEVFPQINTSFKNLEDFFNKSHNEKVKAELDKFNEAVRPEIAICVMGLYSSGKSAFINSLIGQEILQSDSDPATAKIYKIRESKKHSISFTFQNEDYRIDFDGNKWKGNKNPNSEIMRLISERITEKDPKTEAQFMYWTLFELNKYAKQEGKSRHDDLLKCADKILSVDELKTIKNDDEKIEKLLRRYRINDLIKQKVLEPNKLDDVIEVSVKFVHSYLPLETFKFVIYDTPGSNSVMFREHADILKVSLEQQTNGLPIFVTNPDTMDQTDNEEIIKLIDEFGGALDASNMLLVVNRSDEKSKEDLEKKVENKNNLILTRNKNRIYFVSSIIGLGGKKDNPREKKNWVDATYYNIFRKNKEDFEDTESEFYLRLFMYNILPPDVYERMHERIKKISEAELLLWNSGIPCVEEEIGVFAQKYALYNKCSQAIQYLSEAGNLVSEEVREAESKAKALCEDVQRNLDTKKKELIQRLRDECDTKKKKFTSNFVATITGGVVSKYLDDDRIAKIINDAYKTSKGKNDYEKLTPFNQKIEAALQADMRAYSKETSEKTEKYWKECAEELRESLMKIVVGSNALTEEQKEILKKVVLKVAMVSSNHRLLNISSTSAIKNKGERFLWVLWDITHISKSESKNKYKDSIRVDIDSSNEKVSTDNEKMFQAWSDNIITELIATVSSFNPELSRLKKMLDEQQDIIEAKSKQGKVIQSELELIDGLLKFEEVR
ncbi:MAG: hypothetical protein E7288_03780 [Lachnospiraceae bacterium]|nr:hypothetical protein [Lachnospiraceae bacterium]